MREMKESGYPYIKGIPSGWNIRKLKNISKIFVGNSIKDEDKNKYLDNENAIPYIATKEIDVNTSKVNYDNGMYIKIEDTSFKRAKKGTTLMCIEGGSAGKKIAYIERDVSFVNKLCCFESYNINEKFLYYYLKSPAFTLKFDSHISGLIGGVSQNELREFPICVPIESEQEKIAKFLDKKINEIDSIIEKTKETIEDYKKYKNSLIFKMCTNGFSNNYKEANVDWCPKIPFNWKTNKMSQLFFQIKNRNKGMVENNLLSLSYGKIIQRNINADTGLLPDSFETYNIIGNGNIVLRLTDLQNDHKSLRVGLCTQSGIITSAYISLRSKCKLVEKYYYYQLHAFDIIKGFYGMGSGVRQGLTWDELKNMIVITPPYEEQEKIVNYLEKKENEIDSLIKKKESFVEELEQYKKSLIYEYVTGKKEVV